MIIEDEIASIAVFLEKQQENSSFEEEKRCLWNYLISIFDEGVRCGGILIGEDAYVDIVHTFCIKYEWKPPSDLLFCNDDGRFPMAYRNEWLRAFPERPLDHYTSKCVLHHVETCKLPGECCSLRKILADSNEQDQRALLYGAYEDSDDDTHIEEIYIRR